MPELGQDTLPQRARVEKRFLDNHVSLRITVAVAVVANVAVAVVATVEVAVTDVALIFVHFAAC